MGSVFNIQDIHIDPAAPDHLRGQLIADSLLGRNDVDWPNLVLQTFHTPATGEVADGFLSHVAFKSPGLTTSAQNTSWEHWTGDGPLPRVTTSRLISGTTSTAWAGSDVPPPGQSPLGKIVKWGAVAAAGFFSVKLLRSFQARGRKTKRN